MGEALWLEARRHSVRVALRYASAPEEAEDIAHTALLRAWRSRDKLHQPERFFGWLTEIVRNEAFRANARAIPIPVARCGVEDGVEDEAIVAAGERIDLDRRMRELAEGDQVLLRLRYVEDLTQVAIAERLGLPEGTVKVQLHRARAKLHRALSET